MTHLSQLHPIHSKILSHFHLQRHHKCCLHHSKIILSAYDLQGSTTPNATGALSALFLQTERKWTNVTHLQELATLWKTAFNICFQQLYVSTASQHKAVRCFGVRLWTAKDTGPLKWPWNPIKNRTLIQVRIFDTLSRDFFLSSIFKTFYTADKYGWHQVYEHDLCTHAAKHM